LHFRQPLTPEAPELQAKFVFSPIRSENVWQNPFITLSPLVTIVGTADFLSSTDDPPAGEANLSIPILCEKDRSRKVTGNTINVTKDNSAKSILELVPKLTLRIDRWVLISRIAFGVKRDNSFDIRGNLLRASPGCRKAAPILMISS
jgi:hypothetical protein